MSSFRKDTNIEKFRKTSKSLKYSYCLNYELHSIPNAYTLSKYVEHPSCTISNLKERWYRQYRVFVKSSIFSLSSSICLGYSKYCYMWKEGGEFSTKNKAVITWFGSRERTHISILGEKGIYYDNKDQLLEIFLNFKRQEGKDWNAYREYIPSVIMETFKKIYLD